MTASRRALRALALVLLAVVLAGCAGLQTQSEVRSGLDTTAGQAPGVQVVFPPPGAGDTPEEIVRGFIRAGSASEGDYDSARMYLAPSAARSWSPDGEIVIFSSDGELVVTRTSDKAVTVTGQVTATVTIDGLYAALPVGTTRSIDLAMSQVDGQWRIATLPSDFSRWLPESAVGRLIAPYSVHYVARDQRILVEDVRWLPVDHLPSRLARAQLSPVPDYLAGVATTAVPGGTRVTANSVSLQDGVATIDLAAAAPTDEVARENLWAQFVATLTQDSRVTSIVITVAGTPLDLVGRSAPVQAPSDVGFVPSSPVAAPTPMVRREDRIYLFDTLAALVGSNPSAASITPATGRPRIPVDQVDLALSDDGNEVASVSSGRDVLTRWSGETRREVPFFGTSLGTPSYDARGFLWVGALPAPGSATPDARLFVVAAKATVNTSTVSPAAGVEADWLVGRRVLQAALSPDGERIAVLSQPDSPNGDDLRLEVAGIIRGDNGTPTALAVPRRMGSGLSGLKGVTWVDDTRLAVLGRLTQVSPSGVFLLGLGGDQTALPPIDSARSITTTGGLRGLVVVTTTGEIRARVGTQWIVSSTGTDVLAHPD